MKNFRVRKNSYVKMSFCVRTSFYARMNFCVKMNSYVKMSFCVKTNSYAKMNFCVSLQIFLKEARSVLLAVLFQAIENDTVTACAVISERAVNAADGGGGSARFLDDVAVNVVLGQQLCDLKTLREGFQLGHRAEVFEEQCAFLGSFEGEDSRVKLFEI